MSPAHNTTGRATTHLGGSILAAALVWLIATVNPAAAMDEALNCEVEVLLTSIVSVRTLDSDASGHVDAQGEYFVGTLSSTAIGPFDLRSGDSSAFVPGLRLDLLDTGWPRPSDGETVVAQVAFGILVTEDDSNPVGEDDHDDTSEPLLLREHVVCPAGTANIVRTVDVEHISAEGHKRRTDQVRVGLQIRVLP